MYSPAALAIAFFICYPLIFLVSRFLLKKGLPVIVSAGSAEFSAFLLFLVLINAYRLILVKVLDKHL